MSHATNCYNFRTITVCITPKNKVCNTVYISYRTLQSSIRSDSSRTKGEDLKAADPSFNPVAHVGVAPTID